MVSGEMKMVGQAQPVCLVENVSMCVEAGRASEVGLRWDS